MIRFGQFEPKHALGVVAHPSQAQFQWMLDRPEALMDMHEDLGVAFDGPDLIAIGGTGMTWEQNAQFWGWILFTDKITPHGFLAIHRKVVEHLRFFDEDGWPLAAHVDPTNPNSMRWAGLLGMEARGSEVMPDGRRLRVVA